MRNKSFYFQDLNNYGFHFSTLLKEYQIQIMIRNMNVR